VYWGTSALATTYVSATQLTAQVPAADITTGGITVAITVLTPAPGGGTSSFIPVRGRFRVWIDNRTHIYIDDCDSESRLIGYLSGDSALGCNQCLGNMPESTCRCNVQLFLFNQCPDNRNVGSNAGGDVSDHCGFQ
jgi:hypothetical protein